MSAPPSDPTSSISTSGYEDGLGRRTLVFDRASGVTVERLALRPELTAFGPALTERAARVAGFDDARIARVRGVSRDALTGRLTVDSEFVPGYRVSDLLDVAADGGEEAPPGVDVAIGFLLELLPALGAMHGAGLAHGAVAPGRTILTPAGHIVLLDPIFSDVLARLQFTRSRLWTEFGIASPSGAGPARFDPSGDMFQAGVTALMLVLGRPLRRDEYPSGLAVAVNDVVEIAQIRGSADFGTGMQRFLERALPASGRVAFSSAEQAATELREVADSEMGAAACREALVSFIGVMARAVDAPPSPRESRDKPAARPIAAAAPRISPRPAPIVIPPQDPSAPRRVRPAAIPVAAPIPPPPTVHVAEVQPFVDSAPVAEAPARIDEARARVAEPEYVEARVAPPVPEPIQEWNATPAVVDEPFVAPLPELVEERPPVPAAAPLNSWRVAEPARAIEPYVEAPAPVIANEPPPVVAFEAPAAPVVFEPPAVIPFEAPPPEIPVEPEPVVAVAAPAPFVPFEPPQAAAVEPPLPVVEAEPPPVVAFEPTPVPEPWVPAPPPPPPAPVAPTPEPTSATGRRKKERGPRSKRDKLRSIAAPPPAPPPPPPAPVAPPPMPVQVAPPPPPPPPRPMRMPFAPVAADDGAGTSSYGRPSEGSFEPPAAVAPPVAFRPAPAPQPITVQGAGPLRLKENQPAGYTPPRPRYDPPPIHHGGASREAESAGFPWKVVAAAVIVLAVGAFAGRGYLPDLSASPTAAKPAGSTKVTPPPVVAPTPAPTGTIVIATQPAGAKILLDGEPAGESPVTLHNVAVGRRVLTFASESITVKRTIKVEPGKTITLDVPVFSGWIAVFAPILLDVSENGRNVGNTEQGRLLLPPGRHVLTLSNRDLEYSSSHTVEIEGGEERRITLEPRANVSFNAVPWAEVWIDGARAGETPIAKLPVALGTREIVFKNPQFGERRMTTLVKASGPGAISVDFTKPGSW